MSSSEKSDSVGDQAVLWAVEEAYGEMSPARRAELEQWLALRDVHFGAYVRAQAIIHQTEDVVQAAHANARNAGAWRVDGARISGAGLLANDNAQIIAPAQVEAARPASASRRSWFPTLGRYCLIAASVAAMLVAGAQIYPHILRASAAYEDVRLADGSVATLTSAARIQVSMTGGQRNIRLLSGEAEFDVARDVSRPFIVQSGNIYAQAMGTVYSVSRVGDTGGTVRVTEGTVLVWSAGERDRAVLLHANDVLTLDPGRAKPAATGPLAENPRPAEISLDDVPVRVAAEQFNRVNRTRIVIASPEIGDMRIVGLYAADRPEEFAEAVAAIAGGKVEHKLHELVIKSK